MDHSIAIIPPEVHQARGADGFDQGLSIDAHGMNPGSAAIADWRKGWQERQAQVAAQQVLAQAMVMGCPP